METPPAPPSGLNGPDRARKTHDLLIRLAAGAADLESARARRTVARGIEIPCAVNSNRDGDVRQHRPEGDRRVAPPRRAGRGRRAGVVGPPESWRHLRPSPLGASLRAVAAAGHGRDAGRPAARELMACAGAGGPGAGGRGIVALPAGL